MPNYCNNSAIITHTDKAQIEKLKKGCETGLFSEFLPCEKTTDDQRSTWGTKWDVSTKDGIHTVELHDDEGITIGFDTAWCPPIEFYDYLHNELGFGIDAKYFESGCMFYGYYFDGADSCNDYSEFGELPDDIISEFGVEDWEEESEEMDE